MTSNPYLRRLLGEAEVAPVQQPPSQTPPPEETERPAQDAQSEAPVENPEQIAPQTTELVQQWKRGEHMGVAARLMFTTASYKDFVDLIFILGKSDGLMLGQLLDELADTENIEPPKTPPQYHSMLQRAAGANEEEDIL